MRIGSLFDGIGGFPLVASWYGITAAWASEIEAAPVNITKRHFPNMKHLGDITKVNGAEIEPVDIITFGSPCQDLSIAGKRAGLAGSRSGLFGEAIRIIEEMRDATNGVYPTWAIWENVPGALSSNDGLDFRAVLQSFADTEIPMPASGRWGDAGMVRGGKCDFGWRILDAQFWGVPQRRKRVFIVADFRGQRATEILFKSESLRGHFTPSGTEGQRVAADFERGINGAIELYDAFQHHGYRANETCGTLTVGQNNTVRGDTPLVYDCRGNGDGTTVNTITGDHQNRETDYTAIAVAPFDTTQITSKTNASRVEYGAPCHTLNANAHIPAVIFRQGGTVRRLTPLECERLQGYPDYWTKFGHDGKEISDSARYKACGNSLALPCVEYFIAGISECGTAAI